MKTRERKPVVYFTYAAQHSRDSKYTHPTIHVRYAWNGAPHWHDYDLITVTSQMHQAETEDFGRAIGSWVGPYAIRTEVENDRSGYIPKGLLNELVAAYSYKLVVKALRKYRIKRYVSVMVQGKGDDRVYVPRPWKKEADLYITAFEKGITLKRAA